MRCGRAKVVWLGVSFEMRLSRFAEHTPVPIAQRSVRQVLFKIFASVR